jgi:prevent-host-death family protein
MASWKLHEAKAKFSELLDKVAQEGPQVVTRRGEETAIVVPIDEWRRLQAMTKPTLKEFLLGPGPRFDIPIPARRNYRLRRPIDSDE